MDGVGGIVVEVEAYDPETRRATLTAGRPTRNASMFGPPGHAYVYRSYGIHWCLNLVCAEQGRAEAVLVRALEPTDGLDEMRAPPRARRRTRLLCSGPGRLCQALAITRDHDGLRSTSRRSSSARRPEPVEIVAGPRIGITRAAERRGATCSPARAALSAARRQA